MEKPDMKPEMKPENRPDMKPEMKPENRPDMKPEMKPPTGPCGTDKGSLPGGCCASLAFPYIPMQEKNRVRFSRMEGLQTGTLFPGLDLPFKAAIQEKTKMANTALVELMALDFAIDELGLYLDTHPDDREALDLFHSYINLSRQGREKYEKMYGPLDRRYISDNGKYTWINNPWPWEGGMR